MPALYSNWIPSPFAVCRIKVLSWGKEACPQHLKAPSLCRCDKWGPHWKRGCRKSRLNVNLNQIQSRMLIWTLKLSSDPLKYAWCSFHWASWPSKCIGFQVPPHTLRRHLERQEPWNYWHFRIKRLQWNIPFVFYIYALFWIIGHLRLMLRQSSFGQT